jgi:hypothetical protein
MIVTLVEAATRRARGGDSGHRRLTWPSVAMKEFVQVPAARVEVYGSVWHEMALQPRRLAANPPGTMLPQQHHNSLEALSNLLYLARRLLDDPAKASTYLDVADKVLTDIRSSGLLRGTAWPSSTVPETDG